MQAPSCTGSCTIACRGRWSGKGLRFGRSRFPDRKRLVFGRGLADLFGFAGFQLLEPQFELLDVPGQSLRRAAELHPPQLGDLEFELLDFQGTQLDGELCCLQLGGRRCQFVLTCEGERAQCIRIGGQIGRGQRHTLPLSNVAEGNQNKQRIPPWVALNPG